MGSTIAMRTATVARRALILAHRYLGIGISLVLVVWFGSGLVMIYAGGMPRVTEDERLLRAPVLDLAAVRLSPGDALARLGDAGFGEPRLLTILGRPAYRFPGGTVFADDGEVLAPLDADAARRVAAAFIGTAVERVSVQDLRDAPDQWTLQQGDALPMYRLRVEDGAGTLVHVSRDSGEVVLATTARQRALAWVGVIPHWFYFSALRANQPAWYRTVVVLASAACVLVAFGLVLAFTQLDRHRRPFRWRAAIPYRGRFMRWHFIAGSVFGIFALTWAFSGLLSMEPFEWTNARGLSVQRGALQGGEVELAAFQGAGLAGLAAQVPERVVKQIGFARVLGEHRIVLHTTAGAARDHGAERRHQPYPIGGRLAGERLFFAADGSARLEDSVPPDRLLAALQVAVPGIRVVESRLLHAYDSYYYSRGRQLPLPVLRVKFDDPARTWVYVDPASAEVLTEVHRWSRLERWLYNGLHSLDFSFWYGRRPLWDIGIVTLLLGGLATSALGFWLGVRRLVRGPERQVARPMDGPA